MINFYDLIYSGTIGGPLIIIAFAILYMIFLRGSDKQHKHKSSK